MLVFFSSASVLVLEIMAGRLMAPFAGVTLESFTAIIGPVLAGIAVGSWLGGRAADAYPPERLVGPALVAGGLLALLSSPIIQWLGPPLRGGSPVNTVILAGVAFLLPALVLSAVTPVVIKLRLADLGETGTVVGRLSAFATAGAIAGTFVTGFVLVAALPSRIVLLVLGVLLIMVGAWYVARHEDWIRLVALVALAVPAGAVDLAATGTCQIESAYSCIEVVRASETGRLLLMDNVRHSFVDVADPRHLEFRYARVFADVIESQTAGPQRALYVGGGGFTVPQWLKAVRPGSTNTVLELDPALPELAADRLDLEPFEVDRLETGDARLSIRRIEPGSVDLVVADAFGGLVTPWHLTTFEFNADVKRTMSTGGVLVMNVIDQPPVAFGRAEVATLQQVFENVVVVAPRDFFDGGRGGNYVVVGSDGALSGADLRAALERRGAEEVVLSGPDLNAWVGDATALTDDYAPVDQLITR